jgi:ferric enterobactin receptor
MQPVIGSTSLVRILLSLSLLLPTVPCSAQVQLADEGTTKPKALPRTAGDTTRKGTAKITGYVIDSSGTKAVEFASIALYSSKTNKVVDGTVTDEKGRFMLTKLVGASTGYWCRLWATAVKRSIT